MLELIMILGMILFGIFVVVMVIGMLSMILELAMSLGYLVALPFILILPLVVESVRRLYHLISAIWSN